MKFLAYILVASLFSWIPMSFIAQQINPSDWTQHMRFVFVVMSFGLAGVMIVVDEV